MSLQAIFIDREKLIEHENLTEALKELLLSLHKYNVAVLDLGSFAGENAGQAAEKGILERLGIAVKDCLVIADCEETVQQARAWNMAVIGYEPPTVNAGSVQTSVNDGTCRIKSRLDMLVEGFEEVDFYFLERMYQRFHGLPWTVIETERCYLREMTLDDLDDLYELYRPEEMTRYMEGLYEDREKEEEYTRAYIENMYRFYGYGMWVVIEKAGHRLIGRAGLSHLEVDGETQLELGYAIAVGWQQQGIAREVCLGILDYAREALKAPAVYCLIQKENKSSIHLAEKLGFHWEKAVLCNGKEMQRYILAFFKKS